MSLAATHTELPCTSRLNNDGEPAVHTELVYRALCRVAGHKGCPSEVVVWQEPTRRTEALQTASVLPIVTWVLLVATSHTCWSLSSGCVGQCTLYTCRVLLSAPNKPYDFCGLKALGKDSLVKQEKQKQNTTAKTRRVQNRMKTTTKQKQKKQKATAPTHPTPPPQTDKQTMKRQRVKTPVTAEETLQSVCLKCMQFVSKQWNYDNTTGNLVLRLVPVCIRVHSAFARIVHSLAHVRTCVCA